jgi:hypothetical protein
MGGAANFGGSLSLPWVAYAGTAGGDKGFLITGSVLRVVGLSKEFGALCVVETSTKDGGTAVISGSRVWIDPDALTFFPEMVRQQQEAAFREQSEINRLSK